MMSISRILCWPLLVALPALVALMMATTAAPAAAQNTKWHYVAMSSSETVLLVRSQHENGQVAQGNRITWTHMSYAAIGRGGLSYSRILVETDCTTSKYRNLQMINYDVDGSVIDTFNRPSQWHYTAPDSLMSEAVAFICSRRGPQDAEKGWFGSNGDPEIVAYRLRKLQREESDSGNAGAPARTDI